MLSEHDQDPKQIIPRESYHMSSRALDRKLCLDISQNCYQKFVTFVTFVPIEYGTFVTYSLSQITWAVEL